MSIRTWTLKAKVGRARSKWVKHLTRCQMCAKAKTAAGRCEKGNSLIAGYVQHQIDLENADAKKLGVSYAQLMTGGAR